MNALAKRVVRERLGSLLRDAKRLSEEGRLVDAAEMYLVAADHAEESGVGDLARPITSES